jgi:hypothetical protein
MCVVLVDKAWAQVWELYLGEMREITKIKDPALRKPSFAAGMAEYRIRNKADELSRHHYRRVGAVLDELLRAEGFDGLALGGHPHEMTAVTGFLSRDVASRVAGTFAVDPDTATAADVRPQRGGWRRGTCRGQLPAAPAPCRGGTALPTPARPEALSGVVRPRRGWPSHPNDRRQAPV